MLILSTKPTFNYKVKVLQPDGSGALAPIEFMGEFKRFPQAEVDEITKSPGTDAALVDKVFTGWSGVKIMVKVDEKDVEQDLLVTPDNRIALLSEPGVRTAIVRAWLDAAVYGPSKN